MATPPSKITPTASTTNQDPDVHISWTTPSSDGGSAIISYRIRFRASDGTLHGYTPGCPGTDVNVLDCTVPMSVFWSDPFNLGEGDLIVAIVEALNEVDYSPLSDDNISGALV